MPPSSRHWVLTDVLKRSWQENFSVAAGPGLKLAGADGWSVNKYTLRGGLSDGVDVVDLNNGRLSVSILPTRGMGLWRGTCDGLERGWKSPVELPVNPVYVNALDRGGIGWLAGFNEWLCRCGLNSNGPPSAEGTLHGRIANIPAHYVDVAVSTDGDGTISVTGVVDETMMFGPCLRLKSTVQTAAGSNRLTIIDEITNLAGIDREMELLYHTNIGGPFLEEGSRFVAPVISVAPRDLAAVTGIGTFSKYAGPVAGYAEQVFYFDLATDKGGRTQTLLVNSQGDRGLSIAFDKRQLPWFALWKNTQAEADGFCTGLEPATNFPNLKEFERKQGRVVMLPPGGSHTAVLEIAIHSTMPMVRAAEAQIAELQRGHEPKVHAKPQAA
ncbi:MAG: aldose 1-epimerase family protein, partial [Planctomycetia bacterium]|nr:aldose 1-epimerase family protein [Planctomycetia bacterium]